VIDSTQGQEAGLVLPNGEHASSRQAFDAKTGDSVMVVNDTGLPDNMVEDAVADHYVENASLAWGPGTGRA
jgi:hypothetical protein